MLKQLCMHLHSHTNSDKTIIKLIDIYQYYKLIGCKTYTTFTCFKWYMITIISVVSHMLCILFQSCYIFYLIAEWQQLIDNLHR